MSSLPRASVTGVLAVATAVAGLAWAAEKETGRPKTVKITQLISAIKEQKGKVVVIDFWADT